MPKDPRAKDQKIIEMKDKLITMFSRRIREIKSMDLLTLRRSLTYSIRSHEDKFKLIEEYKDKITKERDSIVQIENTINQTLYASPN